MVPVADHLATRDLAAGALGFGRTPPRGVT
jgi:hypothetical protein